MKMHRLLRLWNWLPAFRAVAQTEHLPTASARLNVSASALSRSIRLLEEDVGVPLFDRVGRRLALNAEGKLLLDAVRDAMRRVDDALARLERRTLAGSFGLSAPSAFFPVCVLPALKVLAQSHPDLRPRLTTLSAPDVNAHLLEGTLDLLRRIADDYRPAVLANAFGPESMVMTDLIAKHELDIQVISIDTGRLPEETHALAHSVRRRYGPVITMVNPDAEQVSSWTAQHGQNGFYDAVELRHGCCDVRKVQPLRRALAGKRAWLTGLRRQQSAMRQDLTEHVWDDVHRIDKFNPMLEWSTEQVWAYIRDHRVPYNKLYDRGYTSIGCAPCTRAVSPGEDAELQSQSVV